MRKLHWLPLREDDVLPPCVKCGGCCAVADERFVMLFEDDLIRLGARAAELTKEISGRVFMRREHGQCIALTTAGDERRCAIYDLRPQLCRDFDRDTQDCRKLATRSHPP